VKNNYPSTHFLSYRGYNQEQGRNDEKKRIAKGFWIWGQFSQQSKAEIEAMKEKANSILNGPSFEAHITLSGPLFGVSKKNIEELYKISNKNHKFTICSEGLSYKEEFFQALFIKIQERKELIEFKKLIDQSLKLNSKEFFPHISLFYGNATKESKNMIIKRLNSPKEFTLDCISLVDVDENNNSWRVVERFQLK